MLVEGVSDQIALETLAARDGRDLESEGVRIVPIGGAQAIGRFLTRFAQAQVAGLCDVGEEKVFRRGLERAGYGSNLSREAMERLGFFVCVVDLEDELIRALGPAGVQDVIEAQGELRSLRRFQEQPAQRDRELAAQLHRFLGTRSGRKALYARLLTEAVELALLPAPLVGVLGYARRAAGLGGVARRDRRREKT